MLIALTCFAMVVNAQNELCNVKSNKSTKALYKYLVELSASNTKNPANGKILSGIYGVRFPGRTDAAGAEEVFKETGKWPSLVGLEYCFASGSYFASSASQAIEWKKANPLLEEHWEKGGIIRVLTHFPNPTNPKYGGLRDTAIKIEAILTNGTTERNRWLALLDEVAQGFQDLDAKGISVIYGPLHELNGKWFWWGKITTTQQIELWKDIHNYITNEKKCNNVIWLFTPSAGSSDLSPLYEPLKNYIDMVGLDVYSPDFNQYEGQYQYLTSSGKPFIIAEFGPRGPSGKIENPYDCNTLVKNLKSNWPKTIAFMFWHADKNNPLMNLNAGSLFGNNLIVNADAVKYKGR